MRGVICLALLTGLFPFASNADPPFPLASDPRIDPNKFRVTTFASNLPYPTAMQQMPDQSILVAENDPTGGNYYASTGKLVRFTDADHDGVADDPAGTVLNSSLPGAIVQMRSVGNLLVVTSTASSGSSISILRAGATPTSPYTSVGSITFTFPPDQFHLTYGLASRPTPGNPGSNDIFFNVGSRNNDTNDANTVPTAGLLTQNLEPESIYKFTLTDNISSVALTNVQKIAAGLRNAAGMTFHPTTGDLYLQDNGMDGSPDVNEPKSVDELNTIAAGQIGASVPNFGFAGDYIQYRTGTRIGSGGVQPIVAFQPIPSPDGSQSVGAAEISFAPANFPAGLNNGVFVGFHGRFFAAGVANEKNPVIYVDLSNNSYFQFLSNDLPNIGHIDNLLSTSDSLFFADMTSTGNLFTNNIAGMIYQMTAIPEPALGMLLLMLPLAASRSRKRRS